MAHVAVTEQPGIVGLLQHYPRTGQPLSHLAEALLRGPSPLSAAERELIATYTSTLNRCAFCAGSHGAAARALADEPGTVDATLADPATAPLSGRMHALLAIAARVQEGGRSVSEGDVAAARAEGATDPEIHDTVLIAAAFCMYNRYVDGLATRVPAEGYDAIGAHLAAHGYLHT